MKFGNINLQGLGELQNANIQNLASAPTTNLRAGRIYFNTPDHKLYIYNGTNWVDATSQGIIYSEGNGIDITNNVISIDNTVTGATKCKITYDNNGLVTAGEDLQASDIPSLTLSKISDVTVSASDVNSVTSKIELTDLSIASGSTNYLGYDNTTGKFSANVDTTVTASSNNLVTSGAVNTAIGNALTGALKYQGTWTATSQTDYSSITLPVKKGYMYAVSGNATIGGVEWNSGDYLVINKDVASGGTITSSDVEKIDNTEASDIVRLSATQTLTNKTIDADDNTILDLTTSNFKSGTIVTSVDATGSDTAIPTEKAVRDAIKALSYSEQNSALTASSGVCTWTVTHNLNNNNVNVSVYEVSTGDKVMYDTTVTSANVVTVKILSAANIAADTYKVVVQG